MPSRSTSSSSMPRRLSLAPTHAHNIATIHDHSDLDGASLLMDLSLSDLEKTSSPFKFKKRAIDLSDDALDALSEGELERLAWEAIEEENKLKANRRRSPRLSSDDNAAMKNVTIRRKSNSPKKIIEEMPLPEVLSPLPRTFSSNTVKHSYDRQASPSRSAMKRTTARKSVVFGSIDEYEISVEAADSSNIVTLREAFSPIARKQTCPLKEANGSSNAIKAQSSVSGSSSPLSRFNKGKVSATKGVFKSVIAKVASPRTSPRAKAATTVKVISSNTTSTTSKKMSTKPSPKASLVGSRMRDAIKETSAKSRLKARQSAINAKTKAATTKQAEAPIGFRISSTGTLVAEIKCDPFKSATAKIAPRRGRSSSSMTVCNTQKSETSKANPVPEWIKRRKEALARADDDRLQIELERVRAQELTGNKNERSAPTTRRLPKANAAGGAPTSAVEKRIAERAIWEAKRKEKEDLINAEKEKAKMERQAREEEEYRLARQRTIPRANPVPDFIRSRRAR